MATSGQYVVIGVFDNLASADSALMALQEANFSQDQLRRTTDEGAGQSTHKGIKALFSDEKTTPHKDVMSDLVNMGVDPQDARVYQREYEKGHPLVSVTGRNKRQEAITILHNQGGYTPTEIAERGADYQTTESFAGRAATRPGDSDVSATNVADERAADTTRSRTGKASPAEVEESQRMRLRAERLKASTQSEQVGEVNVRKEIITEQQTLNVPVTREEIVVERRSLAEDAAAAEEPIGEGETIRIPISEERVNITKEAVATGEVEITKRKVKENRQFSDTVRHEEARLENQGDIPIIDTDSNQPPAQPQI